MKTSTKSVRTWLAGFLLLTATATYAQKSEKEQASEAKITVDLLRVQQQNTGTFSVKGKGIKKQDQFLRMEDNMIAIEAIVVDGMDAATLLSQLQGLGLTEGIYEKLMVTGTLPIDKIDELKNLSALRFARPAYEPMHNIGRTTSQGDKAMKSDMARQLYGVTGRGSKIGVLSDTYNALGGAPAGVASGDLPANVQVIDDLPSGSDEGRGMMELIHDVAPDAAGAFNTAFRSQAGFAKGIRDLAAAGCNIIVDDVYYFAEPYFQDGIIAQAVDEVKAKGVTYFSSAGNNARNSYQADYKEGAFTGTAATGPYLGAHNFSATGTDFYHSITVPARTSIRLGLQWDEPFASVSGGTGARSDIDALVFRNGVLQSSSGFSNNIGNDPIELFTLNNSTGTTAVTFEVLIGRYAGPAPSLIKWVAFTNGLGIAFEYPTNSSTCFGHANAAGAIATGAADYRRTPPFNGAATATIEGFSSAGGTPILFTTTGQRISSVIRQKPEITAADGGNTTFFGSDADGDGFPNFFGTSAAAPHAAAVAALMQQQNATTPLTPDRVVAVLEQTALDMDDPLTSAFDVGFDFRTGYGFIQADRAVQTVTPAPTVAATIPNQSGRVGQFFSYMIPASTFADPNYTFSQLTLSVTGLPAGLTFTAPNTISGTPITATGSPFTVTVTATNPAGKSVSTTFLFTIAPPVTPIVSVLHRDVDNYADNNAIQPLLILQSQFSAPLPLSTLTLRYYVTVEGAAALSNLNVNYAQLGNQNIKLRYVPLSPALPGAAGYVEVGFTAAAGNLAANGSTGPMQLYFAKGDYSPLNELDDYSYATVRDQLVDNPRITAYYNNTLIAGVEPGTSSPPPTASGQILRALTESKNGPSATQINTFLEIRNEGNTAVNYSDLKARYYFTADGNERLQVEVDEGNVQARLVKLPAALMGADTYLELTFTQGGQLAAGASTGRIRYRISKPDGGRFDQTNDYSYQEQPADRSQNNHLVVFVGNTRVWGIEPGSSARVAISNEPGNGLNVRLLGNPVQGDWLQAEVTGATGQPLTVQLTDLQGRVVSQQQVDAAGSRESLKMGMSQQPMGMLLLRVSTPQQSNTIKVIKAN